MHGKPIYFRVIVDAAEAIRAGRNISGTVLVPLPTSLDEAQREIAARMRVMTDVDGHLCIDPYRYDVEIGGEMRALALAMPVVGSAGDDDVKSLIDAWLGTATQASLDFSRLLVKRQNDYATECADAKNWHIDVYDDRYALTPPMPGSILSKEMRDEVLSMPASIAARECADAAGKARLEIKFEAQRERDEKARRRKEIRENWLLVHGSAETQAMHAAGALNAEALDFLAAKKFFEPLSEKIGPILRANTFCDYAAPSALDASSLLLHLYIDRWLSQQQIDDYDVKMYLAELNDSEEPALVVEIVVEIPGFELQVEYDISKDFPGIEEHRADLFRWAVDRKKSCQVQKNDIGITMNEEGE